MGRKKGSKNKKTIQKAQIKKIKKLPMGFVIIILIILIVLGLWWYFTIYNNESSNNENDYKPSLKDGIIYLEKEGTIQEEVKVTFLELFGSTNNPQIGDSLLIECGDIDILIDAGEKASGSSTVVPFLEKHVEDKVLEMVIVTHADSDHLGGMVGVSTGYGALEIPDFTYQYIIDFGYEATTQVYKDYVELRTHRVNEGAKYFSIGSLFDQENLETATRFYLGVDTYLDFLDYKTYAMDSITDDNDRSVSCLLTHMEKTFLFTGDSEKKEEEYLTQLDLPKIDVFKANHHGSPTSNTVGLLNKIHPEYVIVCSSETNKYNLPKKTIISRINEYTNYIYATFISGNIEVISKNNQITISSSRDLIPIQESVWYKEDDPNNPR